MGAQVTEDGFNLGVWQNNMRQMYKTARMSAERVAALEATFWFANLYR